MAEPKFLRSTAAGRVKPEKAKTGRPPLSVTGRKSKQQLSREAKPLDKLIPRPVKPVETPSEALATLSDAWQAAQAAQFAGTTPDSAVGKLIADHLERVDAVKEARAAAPVAEDVVTNNIQDQLVAQHRADIAETRRLVMGLIAELDAALMMEELFTLIADVVAPVDDKGELVHKVSLLRKAFYDLIALPSKTDLALKLTNSLRALIPLERQAAGLPDGYVDAATERAKKEASATATVIVTSFDAIKGKFDQIMLQKKAATTEPA